MQFVKRSICPQLLKDNQQEWTQPWVDYYINKTRSDKPTDGHWRKDEIREPLIKDFHDNCGYCGCSIPKPMSYQEVLLEIEELKKLKEREFSSKGDVDHLLPKSKKALLVYAWLNYVWSCKACNQVKGNFYDAEYPLLNPCDEHDCTQIEYNEDTGFYILNDEVKEDNYWLKRWEHTQVQTLISDSGLAKERKLKISALRDRFEFIVSDLKLQAVSNTMELKQRINKNIRSIHETIDSPQFYFILQKYYHNLRAEYPQVAKLIDQVN